MSPKLTLLLTLPTIMLAGAPLAFLVRPEHKPGEHHECLVVHASTPLTVEFDGQPASLALYQQGDLLDEMPPGTVSPWLPEVEVSGQSGCEIEMYARWQEAGAHSATLRAEPAGKEACEQTRRTQGTELHDLFRLTW